MERWLAKREFGNLFLPEYVLCITDSVHLRIRCEIYKPFRVQCVPALAAYLNPFPAATLDKRRREAIQGRE